MNPLELAAQYFPHAKHRGEEVIPKFCPFCEGGKNNDTHSFAMHAIKGTYNCKRGSCGASGSFKDLCEHFGEEAERNETVRSKPREYRKPQVKTSEPTSKVQAYLKKRGFSEGTIKQWNVREKDGLIVFPYYEDGSLVLVKYRRPEKYTGQGSKYWQEGGGKPVLWGMDRCDTKGPLVITEGEFDAMTLTEAGVSNAVSIPFGTQNTEWIKECWEFLDRYDRIVLWADGDDAGREMLEEVVPRLGEWRCAVVNSPHKDANLHLYKDGAESVRQAVDSAEDVPIRRLIRMSDVETLDPAKMDRALSGISGLNRHIGGYIYGTTSVWTGDNASGKSTFLCQEIIECVEQDVPAFVYSSELPHGMLRYWMHLQMAGVMHVREKEDRFVEGRTVYYVPEDKEKLMMDWYRDHLFLYDHLQSTTPKDIMSVFDSAAMRYGCKVFLLDNLMAVNYGGRKNEYYHRQSEFVSRLIEFADKFHAHVHIVAHPKKSDSGKLTKDDIAGLKEVTNKAHNVLAIHRIEDDDRDSFDEEVQDCDAVVDVLKSRIYGKQNVSVGLLFEEMCKRFYMPSCDQDRFEEYGWARQEAAATLDGCTEGSYAEEG